MCSSDLEKCLKCYEKFNTYSEEDRVRIRRWYNEKPWFFPPYGGVMGFFGTDEVIFVGQRPSTGGGVFPDKVGLLFYNLMKEYGFGDAHLTDLVKCKGLAGKVSAEQIDNCLQYLKEEIALLKPKLIVALGNDVFNVLRKLELPTPLEKVTHYSDKFKRAKETFEEGLKRIKKLADELPIK